MDTLMRFHLIGLPHTKTSKAFSHCAYTQKVVNMASMLMSLGHEVYHYGAEGSEVECTEHITVITSAEQEQFFGAHDPQKLPVAKFDVNEPYWRLMNERTAAAVLARQQRGDFLLLIAGTCQKPIADAVGESCCMAVEWGIGYYGTFAKYRVFESYTHAAAVYGQQSMDPDGRLYDAVIPNSFDPEDFPMGEHKEDCLLFLARVIQRKGIEIAVETARATGLRLVVAGQGVRESSPGRIVTDDGMTFECPGLEYVGSVGPEDRAMLMGDARALIQPTLFMEPFGGNVVEAQLCGTPVITTDYAAFSETVRHGVTGYRCHRLAEFVWAADAVRNLDHAEIRRIALANYSIHRVRLMYAQYFSLLQGLWGAGWPDLSTPVNDLDWLNKVA